MMVKGLIICLVFICISARSEPESFSATSELPEYTDEFSTDMEGLAARKTAMACKAIGGECYRKRKDCPDHLPLEMGKMDNFCNNKFQRCCYADLTGCTNASGNIFSYDGKSFCALQNRTAWNESRTMCEGIGMHLAMPEDPVGLSTYLSFIGVPCSWFWLGGKGNYFNQVWMNGTPIMDENPLWYPGSTLVSNEYCLDLNVCDPHMTPLQTYPCVGHEFVLCEVSPNLTRTRMMM